MATRAIVPRADGEGSLGTTTKKWGGIYVNTAKTNTIYAANLIIGVSGGIDFRIDNAAGIVGHIDPNNYTGTAAKATADGDGNEISATYAKRAELEPLVSRAEVHMLERNKAYKVGDIAYSPNLPSYMYLECVTAGTTSAKEPDFSEVTTGG